VGRKLHEAFMASSVPAIHARKKMKGG
ncbi:hypothetical protein A2U01_0115331, partial [Trifolium medium]|nr:hypothetical protein [Trifolium medium]